MTTPQPLPSTLFTTDQQAGEARFEAWRQSISVVFDVAPLVPQGIAAFQATVHATHLGHLLVGDLHFAEQQFLRSQPRVVRDGLDHYLVQWYRTGGFVGQRDGGVGRCAHGARNGGCGGWALCGWRGRRQHHGGMADFTHGAGAAVAVCTGRCGGGCGCCC